MGQCCGLVEPQHIDADPDSTYHPDADPDSDLFDANANPSFQIKAQTLEKTLK